MTKLFGSSLLKLPNIEQVAVLETIPEGIKTVEKKFNLDIETVPYAHGRPLKVFEFYPFFEWFSRFLTIPGIAEYSDRFCDEVLSNSLTPKDKIRTSDGRFYREFEDGKGGLFVADHGEEGRWFFLLYANFFNVEGKGACKRSSTGIMAITCLNLPPEMRNDIAYTYIPGIIQGHHEPISTSAQHQHYLAPVVSQFEIGYSRG
ncbi:hypothetical protein GYMLUDRAFT_167371, partial [Collybiopsis luxurians FD-317 M1]